MTTPIVASPAITGNIGSCEVKKTDISVDSFHMTTVAINSCDGSIVSQNTYFDYSWFTIPLAIIFIVVAIVGSIVGIVKVLE